VQVDGERHCLAVGLLGWESVVASFVTYGLLHLYRPPPLEREKQTEDYLTVAGSGHRVLEPFAKRIPTPLELVDMSQESGPQSIRRFVEVRYDGMVQSTLDRIWTRILDRYSPDDSAECCGTTIEEVHSDEPESESDNRCK